LPTLAAPQPKGWGAVFFAQHHECGLGYSATMKYITCGFIFTCSSLLLGCDCGPMGTEPAAFQQESGAAYTQQQLEQTQEPDDPTFMLPDQ